MPETLWSFDTLRFRVVCTAEPEYETIDLSWDETGEVRDKIERGIFEVFCAKVAVYLDGCEIGTDYLGECIYERPDEFVTAHRDPDPMNRNCTIMRAARGGVVIGHSFPDMVKTAISEARRFLQTHPRPKMREAA